MPFSRRHALSLLMAAVVCHAAAAGAALSNVPAAGDDFFAYANHEWLSVTSVPAGKPSWTARSEIVERTGLQLLELRQQVTRSAAGTPSRKLADFVAAYRDVASIEARGLTPLKAKLDRIDAIQDKTGLARHLGEEMPVDADPVNAGTYESAHPIGLAIQAGLHGEPDWVVYLLQGGAAPPVPRQRLDDSPQARDAGSARHREVAGWLARLGGTEASAAAGATEVVALEAALAASHLPPERSADEANARNVWTREQFARLAPGLDWQGLLAAAGLQAQDTFVVWQPGAMQGLAALVASQPLATWKDYLRVRMIQRHLDVLPRAVSARSEGPDQRTEAAWRAAQVHMGDVLSHAYAQQFFPADHKRQVQAIAANVTRAFMKRVERTPWMQPQTRAIALAKLQRLYAGIAYPDRWPDWSTLAIDPTDPVKNLLNLAAFRRHEALARLGRPVDRTAWWIAPHAPGASLSFQLNANNFAAALLQAPKFDPAASDATNYGAIGAIFGHEISHFVDTLGADHDVDGKPQPWWTDQDRAAYRQAAAPLARQFSSYRPFADAAVDGELSLTENVADLAGLQSAFDAYRSLMKSRGVTGTALRRADREFFIGFARSWRAVHSEQAMRKLAASDHAPESYRVATVRNLDAWYEAFEVKPGQRLFLPRQARVKVW